jgi:sec-independent protein translocase protein TatA
MRLEPWHVLVLLAVVLVLFGYKRLPDAARSMGRSMRIFKSEIDTMREDGKKDDKAATDGPVEPLSGRIVDDPPAARAANEKTTDERR